jgi:D-alanyl-D-alanine carboxypeptidase/D-alanyl-D-alanine-endopeptidase (penicillin-binding protein 4)
MQKILSDSLLRTCTAGVKVISLHAGKTLFEYNSNKLLHPASNIKLFTTASALHYLGKDFAVRTEIFIDNHKNLYIKSCGDPLLRTENFISFAQELMQKGYNECNDIVADVSYFDDNYWGKGWMWDDEPDKTAMYISSLTINSNSIAVFISPSSLGMPPQVALQPHTNFVLLLNQALTTQNSFASISKFEVTRKWKERENTILIKGNLPIAAARDTFFLNVWNPVMYALTVFKEQYETAGGNVSGKLRIGKKEKSSLLISHHTPLDSLLAKANKESDNLTAENLLRIIAAEKFAQPAFADDGIFLEKKYLFSFGIDTAQIILADGSGASDYNLASADNIVTLLERATKNKQTFTNFRNSLAIAGKDGTLKNRMNGTIAENIVSAKTGTKRGVSSLSGYIMNNNEEEVAFSIIINHFYGEGKILRGIIDSFTVALVKQVKQTP